MRPLTAPSVLRAVLSDMAETSVQRRAARDALIEFGGPDAHRIAADSLRRNLADANLPVVDRYAAARQLAAVCRDCAIEALPIVRAIDVGATVADRINKAQTILDLDHSAPDALETLCALIVDHTVPIAALWGVTWTLANGTPVHKNAASAQLRQLLAAPQTHPLGGS